ncbi:hypothetical protein ACLBKU_11885 [Erythrobacter sp. NE805]|uniref:hypothetical protein n=1 Tax=Erythrobacter sp. NE805 TaxID=3389875 RepID=UPI00396B4172
MSKPSLHEIAAMPFPASIGAMRKHYVHDWAKPLPEGATEKARYEVTLDLTVTSREVEIIEVEAWSEDEALEAAEAEAWRIYSHSDVIAVEEGKVRKLEVEQ